MSNQLQNILFVFNGAQDSQEAIQQNIARYQRIIGRMQKKPRDVIRLHLLYVMPHIPGYALRLPQLVQWAQEEEKFASLMIQKIGDLLAIPPERRYLREGLSDFEAWFLSHHRNIDKVYGYSATVKRITQSLRKKKKQLKAIKNLIQHITLNKCDLLNSTRMP